MIKVMFMKPDGDELLTKELTIEQIQALKLVNRIEFVEDDDMYCLNDMDYNVDNEHVRVWLKEEQ